MKRLRRLTLVCLCLASGFAGAETPDLLLANVYEGDVELSHYWISEKLDGVRARWDGTHLISRGGNVFHAPTWFTRDFPDTPLDGELWMGRGTFEALSGTVRQERPDDTQWRRVKYMVFDLPSYPGTFDERLLAMRRLVVHSDSRYLDVIKQFKVDNAASLRTRLLDVVAAGGEGLMLHRADSTYRAGRSDDLLKLKLYRDAEATVIGYTEGSGKYAGMLGAIVVETPEGLRFRIGTGFSDKDREDPPSIGATITYKFFGRTRSGIPRLASFMRVRDQR